ncbi:putative heat shock protein 70 family protein, partial [Tanacetum coccineum]
GTFEVKAVSGDTHLGGEDFDNRMVSHCVQEFKRNFDKDLTGNQRALGRLKFACEKAKRILSSTTRTSIELDGLHEGIDFLLKFSRAKFDELNMGSFNKCIETVETCLNDAKIEKSCINQVILVGGSTRIPKVQHMLQEFFDGKELCKTVNPDEAVAYGAAVMAANLTGKGDKTVEHLLLLDVTPFHDKQSAIRVKVNQGERARSTHNHFLGDFRISGLPLAPKGAISVTVWFEIDVNGILTVTGGIIWTGQMEKLTITNENIRLSMEEIEKMVNNAQKYRIADQEFKKLANAYNELEDCIYKMNNKVSDYNIKKRLDPEILKPIKCAIANMTNWLQANQAAPLAELQLKKVHLEFVCKPLF